MNFKTALLIFTIICITNISFSQEIPKLKDTVPEIIIYEYDTVFIKPDTIRLTDTLKITEALKEKNKPNKRKNNINLNRFLNKTIFSSNSFLSPITPDYVNIGVSTFYSGMFKNNPTIDTLSYKPQINKRLSILWNYKFRKNVIAVGLGFTPYKEKYTYQKTNYTSNNSSNNMNPYDSLLVINNSTYNYFFNYLDLYLLYGRIWTLTPKINLEVQAGCISNLLIGFKQGNSILTKSMVKKNDISLLFSTIISYNISGNIEVYLSPFYQQSFFNDTKYPKNTFQIIGIGAGLNIILK